MQYCLKSHRKCLKLNIANIQNIQNKKKKSTKKRKFSKPLYWPEESIFNFIIKIFDSKSRRKDKNHCIASQLSPLKKEKRKREKGKEKKEYLRKKQRKFCLIQQLRKLKLIVFTWL
jgi:hypothetical protein